MLKYSDSDIKADFPRIHVILEYGFRSFAVHQEV